MCSACQGTEVFYNANPALPGCGKDAGQNRVRSGAGVGLVATAGLPSDHRRAEGALRPVIGRLRPLVGQEGEQVAALLAKPLGKAGVVRIGKVPFLSDQLVQPLLEFAQPTGKLL